MRRYFFKIKENTCAFFKGTPTLFDAVILSVFSALITLQPFFLHGEINFFELGIYLPGIDALLDGRIPYRDFFHLRGPVELYLPALLMKIFGEHIAVLYLYFYVGTVITLAICAFLAKEIYKTRLVLYLMIPVLVARTFPRVVFHIWGGLRFGLGLLAVLFAVYFFKTKQRRWLFLAGMTSSLTILTSIDTGASAVFGVGAALLFGACLRLQTWRETVQRGVIFGLGVLAVLLPYGIYLAATQSLVPYLDATYSVLTRMTEVFPDHLLEEHPRTLLQAMAAMIPSSDHFKHLTPAYCYLFFTGWMWYRWRTQRFVFTDLRIMSIAFYGLMLYVAAFRKIGAGQFEMALQPEKMLLFFMLEEMLLFLRRRQKVLLEDTPLKISRAADWQRNIQIAGISLLSIMFVMSSYGYAMQRYNHRFISFRIIKDWIGKGHSKNEMIPTLKEDSVRLTEGRVAGLVAPVEQAESISEMTKFLREKAAPDDPILFFPELGTHYFITDRPFIGRFPMTTFAWMNPEWHKELFADIQKNPPKYVLMDRDPGPTFAQAYFKIPQNKEFFDDIQNYIDEHYAEIASTPELYILERKAGAGDVN